MITIQKDEADYTAASVDITEANMNNSEQFKAQLLQLLSPNKKMVMDLSSIAYMDSSFLGALVASLKQAIAIKADIILVGLQPDIYNLFTLIRLDKVFKIYGDVNEALAN
jgi:anti-sigma B factor antagonist